MFLGYAMDLGVPEILMKYPVKIPSQHER